MQRQRGPGSVPGLSIRARYCVSGLSSTSGTLLDALCIIHLPPKTSKVAGAALTSRVFCSLVRTHTQQKTLTLACQTAALLCSGPVLYALLDLSLFLRPNPPLPPLSPVTVQVQCSIAQRRASCPVHDPYAHFYSPSHPTRRLLFSSSEDSFPSLPSCRRGPDQLFPILFFSLQPSKPSLRRPPTCLAVPFLPLSTATDPSFSANGGKHLSKILQQ